MNYKSTLKALVPNKFHGLLYKSYYFSLPVRSLFYLGDRFSCPCCGGSFKEFISIERKFIAARPNNSLMLNEQCPRCDSWKRQRVLWLYLKNYTNFFREPLKVLHFAPEYCLQKKFKKQPNLDYISADLFSSLAMTKIDITDIPYPDNTFDVILCSHVLEHIPDDRKAMKELLRVLKPTGWAILQVPIDRKRDKTFEDPAVTSPQERERLFGQHDHVRFYGRDYQDRLRDAGFVVEVNNYIKDLEDETVEKYSLDKQEDIYLCKK
jgi:predicted SAM-dependent methyltransferase